MKTRLSKAGRLALAGIVVLSPVGCFPAYPPQDRGMAYGGDAKGYDVQQEPAPPSGPRMVGVDPALLVAGAAAAGLIGYAIGHHHHDHYYGGPVYYRPVPYGGYYGPRHYYR